jgi:hypothetical protein
MTKKDIFEFFCILLAIGLITKEEVINWADNEILIKNSIDNDLIELSLSGSKSLSQLLVVMNLFNGKADYKKVICFVLAYASKITIENEEEAKRLIYEISLLKAEWHLSKELIDSINQLAWDLEKLEKKMINLEELNRRIILFFERYSYHYKEVQAIFFHE